MKSMYTLLAVILFMATSPLSAQNTEVHEWLQHQKKSKTLERVSIIKGAAPNLRSDKIRNTVANYYLVDIDRSSISGLNRSKPQLLDLEIPIATNKSLRLHLAKAQILSDDFVLETPSQKYDKSMMGTHYRGTVDGRPGTFAALSFYNGEMMGMISTSAGNYVIGELEDQSKRYIVYNDKALQVAREVSCGTPDTDVPQFDDHAHMGQRRAIGDACKIVKLYWEADKDLHDNKGSVAATASYIAGAFNQMATLYQNDGILVELSGTLVWDTADPYRFGSSSEALDDFQLRWNGLGNNFNGDLAHLVALDPGGLGGLAYRGVLCNRPNAYAYSDIGASYDNVPTYSWTIEVLAHEIGHNLGSRHTHACAWNGNNTPIDDCGSQVFVTNGVDDDRDGSTDEIDEAVEAGGVCFDNVDNTIPASGTIMSYCHLLEGRGESSIDFRNGFGPQPTALIKSAINAASCLEDAIDLATVKTDICPGGSGAIDLTVSGDGTPTYSYSWMPGGATSQDLSSIASAGTYAVTVTDANSCTSTTSVEISSAPAPGDGDNTLQCSTADFDVALATTGMSLGTDEVVGWWVTGTNPITSTVTDQTTLDASMPASAGGTVSGASPNLVFEATSGASLDLNVVCSNLILGQTYYATPFVSAKKAAIAPKNCNRTFNSSGITVGTTPGAWVFSSAVACTPEGRPTPPDFSIDINVTTYAGTANELTILIREAGCGTLLVADFGNAGTGTYTFTQSDFPAGADPTAGFCIVLYDQTQPPSNTIVFNAEVNIDYAGVAEITFPTASYTSCLFGTPIPFSCDNSCVAPVELSYFKALKNNDQVDLLWETTSERNADYFEVQRSANGIDFSPIGRVAAAGNSSRKISYEFIDESPLAGRNFYRLMQVDKDRSIEFSEMREVLFTKKGIVSIYPVPVKGNVFVLRYDSFKNEEIEIKIFDVAGKMISIKNLEVKRGLNELQINAEYLPKGMYLLQAIQGESIQSKPFVRS